MAIIATYVSATSFTVVGNSTTLFSVGRVVKANCGTDGIKFCTVESRSYSNPNTSVTLKTESDVITSNLVSVEVGVISQGGYGSLPAHDHKNMQGQGGSIAATDEESAIGATSGSYVTPRSLRYTLNHVYTIAPSADGEVDLGTDDLRFRTVYTNDLELRNAFGDYTVVEGEEDLFLYNNKTGKVFKFMLTEVDWRDAPPKVKRK